jgi:hypothetical protein
MYGVLEYFVDAAISLAQYFNALLDLFSRS